MERILVPSLSTPGRPLSLNRPAAVRHIRPNEAPRRYPHTGRAKTGQIADIVAMYAKGNPARIAESRKPAVLALTAFLLSTVAMDRAQAQPAPSCAPVPADAAPEAMSHLFIPQLQPGDNPISIEGAQLAAAQVCRVRARTDRGSDDHRPDRSVADVHAGAAGGLGGADRCLQWLAAHGHAQARGKRAGPTRRDHGAH